MKVLFFAQSRSAARCDYAGLKTEGPLSQTEFWDLLVADFPDLVPLRKTARLARDEAYLQVDELLQPGDEIAIIPPVSGG